MTPNLRLRFHTENMNSALLNPISAEAVTLFTVNRETRTANHSTGAKGTISNTCASYPAGRVLWTNFLIFGAPIVLSRNCLVLKVLGYLQFTVQVSSLVLRMLWAGEVKLL